MKDGYKVASGDRIGKTIIFAASRLHAEFIERRFNLAYPDQAGKTARTITHGTPYAQSLIDEFSDPAMALDIAISVDMLDTGIDVPEVVNLVFFKPVMSKVKFWRQMIRAGPGCAPDLYGQGRTRRTSWSSTSAATWSSSARTYPDRRGRRRSPSPSGSSRPESGSSPRSATTSQGCAQRPRTNYR